MTAERDDGRLVEESAPGHPGADRPSPEAEREAAEQPLPEPGDEGAAEAAASPEDEDEAAAEAAASPEDDDEAAAEAAASPEEEDKGAVEAAASPEDEAAPEAAAPPHDLAAEYLALAQRTQADFENFRKRAAREAAAAADRGMRRLAKELLPALDHLELALRAAEEHGGGEFAKGIRQIQDEMYAALGRVGIQPFSPKGEAFDPNEHEAMASQPVEDAESGTVVEVYQQGYRINGAVLRPARVVVAA